MAFFEQQFPPDYLLTGFNWRPQFHTTTVEMGSGYEQRNKDWSTGRGRGTADLFRNEADKEAILAFFYNVAGGFDGFRAKIWADYTVTNQKIADCNGAITQFQFIKEYKAGDRTYTRKILKPVNDASLHLSIGATLGSATPVTSGFTVDSTTGIVTFTSAPANGNKLWFSCEFDTPVRMNDELDINVAGRNDSGLLYNIKFEFMEIRL